MLNKYFVKNNIFKHMPDEISKELRNTNNELGNINETLKSYTCTLYDSSEKEIPLSTIFNDGIVVRESIISIFKEGVFNTPKLDDVVELMNEDYSMKELQECCKVCLTSLPPFDFMDFEKIHKTSFLIDKLRDDFMLNHYSILIVLDPRKALKSIIDIYGIPDITIDDFSIQLKQIESYIDKKGLKDKIDSYNEKLKPYIEQALDILFKNNLKEKIEFKCESLKKDSIIFTFGEYTLLIKCG